jgi:hypothetical protein
MSLIAMAFLFTGSQIPVYIFGTSHPHHHFESRSLSIGGIPPYIYSDIGGVDRWIWFVRQPLAFPVRTFS